MFRKKQKQGKRLSFRWGVYECTYYPGLQDKSPLGDLLPPAFFLFLKAAAKQAETPDTQCAG